MSGDIFRRAIAVIIIALAAGVVYFQYQNSRPCVRPIAYRLGTIDPRFGESNTALLQEAARAVALWNSAAGKTLFTYDPKAELPVNLIYDNRQQAAQLGNEIKQTQASYQAQKAAIDQLQAIYEADLANYNEQVKYWNAHGGAPASAYSTLEAQKATLDQERTVLNAKIAAFNAETRATNQTINTYNATAASQFEEGEYVRDSSGERINVFEFSNNTQLERLLAHELGHALGLDHVAGADSIMYPLNKSKSLTLSADDLAALKALCNF